MLYKRIKKKSMTWATTDVKMLNASSVATILPLVAIVGVDASVVPALATGEREKTVLIEMLVKVVEVKMSI